MTPFSRFRVVALVFSISSILFFLSSETINAFVEEFNSGFSDPAVWSVSTNSGSVAFSESHLQLLNSARTDSFPYVISVGSVFPPSGSLGIKIDFNFLSAGNFGDGMGISPNSPPNGAMLGPNLNQNLLFWVWHDPSGLGFYTTVCPKIEPGCNRQYTRIYLFSNPNFNFSPHFIALSMDLEGRYHFFLDSDTNEIFTSSTNQPRPTSVWFGSPERTNSTDYWNSLQIDKIEIQSTYPFPTPTPTPAPTPEPLRPIIILPGLGGSWDY